MEHIKKIKAIKTFEELLILRDKYDKMVSDNECEPGDKGYDAHVTAYKYRNMLEDRVQYLSKRGAYIDQIENVGSSLPERSKNIELLEAYSTFLQKEGYLDTDYNSEEPFAIDVFLGDNEA